MGKGSCCVCHRRITKGCKYSLHRFPKNAERSSLWLKACKFPVHRDNVLSTMHVCSGHFTDDSFRITRPGGPRFLKQEAVPSIFDVRRALKRPFHEVLIKEENVDPNPNLLEDPRFHDCSVPDAEILENKVSVVSTPNIKKNTATLSWSVPIVEMFVPEDFNTDASPSQDAHFSDASITVWRPHRVGNLEPAHFSTPTRARRHLTMVKDAIAEKNKKIKLLQQKTRRLTKQVTRLTCDIQQLKKEKLIPSSIETGSQTCRSNETSDSESIDDTSYVQYVTVKERVKRKLMKLDRLEQVKDSDPNSRGKEEERILEGVVEKNALMGVAELANGIQCEELIKPRRLWNNDLQMLPKQSEAHSTVKYFASEMLLEPSSLVAPASVFRQAV